MGMFIATFALSLMGLAKGSSADEKEGGFIMEEGYQLGNMNTQCDSQRYD